MTPLFSATESVIILSNDVTSVDLYFNGDVMIDAGRVCTKKTGRDTGERCVIINVLDDTFVEIVTKGRKQARKVNISHLIPLDQTVDPKSEEQIKAALFTA